MKFFAAIAALVVAAVANAQSPAFTNCATGATDMTVSAFSVSPYPLCIGQNVCASVTGTLSTPVITGAKLAITGRYGGRVVYTDNQDLCTVLAASGHPCPVATSVTSITACVLVKTTAPANVPVALVIQATNGNGNVLFCQTATVTAKVC
ncbi:hypothetical protein BC939DRAFT_455811 [Gamsiella multidivaricata]|uniref:uncharacterized protein n=1 Tax=Gamsiella multidivaricata TaxID=101098 RepID=UPI002220FD81|nr:uncharacterized protein BC939DRAFT_455811 [Gamsiella multidivaricata]KAG0365104.1 hypothetical protein BGZ54_006856 [Gamsiella multidivaricata]KAI7821364.1 hypothetical protein BC939DRAFT_455811 [Gamsiella multidivaricata]